ncbi:ATP-binding protein [Aquimarina gracilis]|uniref:histidine kinase n=1 Tax=Aquimarina gracilis TaxID=874422 RepID=A0ABU5ZWZ9_9FLAO|nr:ATP-binding protein [Aquimarina gracilis]MEB3346363.1 ATP-binding protein [Aquimarina gracilis]
MKQKLTFLFLFVCGFTNISWSYQKDTPIIETWKDSCKYYGKIRKYDSAVFYSQKILNSLHGSNDSISIAKALFRLGYYQRANLDIVNAFENYNKSYQAFVDLKDSVNIGKKALNISNLQNSIGDFSGAEITAINGLKHLKNTKENKYISGLYNSLAISSSRKKDYADAISWYEKAVSITSDSISLLKYHNNIAVALIHQAKYKTAQKKLVTIISSSILGQDSILLSKVKDNLAYTKSLLNEPTAEKELLQALEIRKKIKDYSGQFASCIHLTEYYQNRNQDNIALDYANKAYHIANQIKSTESKLKTLSLLIDLENNPKKVAKEYRKLNDSINDYRSKIKNQFAKIIYGVEEKQKENLLLKTEAIVKDLKLSKETSRRNVLVLVSFTLAIAIISIVLIWKQRIKTARIEERHKTNARLSKKLHDEVGNDLYYLLLQLQKVSGFDNNHENLKILKGFDSVYNKIRDFSRDHKIETGEEYGDELLSLLDSYGDEETKVITSELEPGFWNEIAPLKKEELYFVLKELLTNMKRHSKANVVAITFTKENKKVIVTYVDNGIGTDLNKTISKNGLSNVEIRMKDIGGTITFDSKPEEGFKATMVFST